MSQETNSILISNFNFQFKLDVGQLLILEQKKIRTNKVSKKLSRFIVSYLAIIVHGQLFYFGDDDSLHGVMFFQAQHWVFCEV